MNKYLLFLAGKLILPSIFFFFPGCLYVSAQQDNSPNGEDLLQLAAELYQQERNDSSIKVYKKAIARLKKEENHGMLFKAYGNIAFPLYVTYQYNALYAYSDSALELAVKHDYPLISRLSVLHNRSGIYEKMGMYEERLSTLRRIKRLLPDSTNHMLNTVVNLGLAWHFADIDTSSAYHRDSAIYYSRKALISAKRNKDTSRMATASIYLAINLAKDKGPRDSIESLFDFAEQTFAEGKFANPYLLAYTLILKAKSVYFEGKEKEALTILDRPEKISRQYGHFANLLNILELKYHILRKLGQFEEALTFRNEYFMLKDSLAKVNNKNEMARLEVQHQTREKEYQLKLSRTENQLAHQTNRKLIYVIILLIIIFILGIGIVYLSIRHRKKLAVKREKEIQLELANRTLKEEQLRAEVDFKSRQLTARALELSKMAETNKLVIDGIKSSIDEGPDHLKKKVFSWERKLNSSTQWEDFYLSFQEVHPSFFDRITGINPNITEKEKRLMAFAKLGLNIKEMASLLSIEPNSVKTSRYRIKKKFNIPPEQSLESFVAGL